MKRPSLRQKFGFGALLCLAVALGLGFPKIDDERDGKTSKAQNDLSEVSKMLELFMIEFKHYPASTEGLPAMYVDTGRPGWHGISAKPIPPDPWGNSYVYINPSAVNPQSYTLLRYGRDGKPGGEGQDADIVESP